MLTYNCCKLVYYRFLNTVTDHLTNKEDNYMNISYPRIRVNYFFFRKKVDDIGQATH